MPTLKQRLQEYVSGCFTGIWVETQEPMEAISDIQSLCQDEAWQFGRWDIDQGLRVAGQAVEDGQDPLSAVKSAGAMGDGPSDDSLLTLLRKSIRSWCKNKLGYDNKDRLYEPWFFFGNPPKSQYVVTPDGVQVRTATVSTEGQAEPEAWALELVHRDHGNQPVAGLSRLGLKLSPTIARWS